ncbi:MAG: OmpA family protein [Pseudomonadota bacterium]
MKSMKTTAIAATTTLALAGCVANPDPNTKNTRIGAAIGAATGAATVLVAGGDSDKLLAGAVVGGIIGAVAGNLIDRQEAELRKDLGGSGAVVSRDGDQLTVTLPEAVTFNTDSTAVRSSLRGDLVQLAANLRKYPESTVDVVGHTDSVGDSGYNQNLSSRRAAAVSSILSSNGVQSERIRAYGRGEVAPAASNQTAAGRAANRRVEIVINPKA